MNMTVSNQMVYDTMNMDQKALFTQDIRRAVEEAVTQDRKHTAQVLCDLLEEEKSKVAYDSYMTTGERREAEKVDLALTKAQALIRQTLDPSWGLHILPVFAP